MRFSFSTIGLAGLALQLGGSNGVEILDSGVEASPKPGFRPSPRAIRDDATRLLAIDPRDFDHAAGIERRDTDEMDGMTPMKECQMAYGSPAGPNRMVLANMTMFAQENLPIVMMEKFAGLTSHVDCHSQDGQMSLTFRDAAAYKQAAKVWAHLNEKDENQFLMIANHPSCSDPGQRQPFKVSNIVTNEKTKTTHLKAAAAEWKKVASDWNMDFGKADIDPKAQEKLRHRRDFLGFLGDALEGIKDGFDALVSGDGNFTKSVNLPLKVGTPNEEHLLFLDPTRLPPRLKLTCTSCFAQGSFQVKGSMVIKDFSAKQMRLDIQPKGLHAELKMAAEIGVRNDDTAKTSIDKTLFEAAIPGAGIDIPKIFSLGAKAQFNVQARANLIGQATINLGGKATVPDTARITADLVNFDQSGAFNFDDTKFDPILDLGSAAVTVNMAAGPQPALVLGATILDDNGIEAKLLFGTPTLNLNATAGFDQAGFCEEDPQTTSGFKLQSAANFDVVMNVEAQAGSSKKNLFQQKLVNIPLATFLNKCLPVKGLTPINKEKQNVIKNDTAKRDAPEYRWAHPFEG